MSVKAYLTDTYLNILDFFLTTEIIYIIVPQLSYLLYQDEKYQIGVTERCPQTELVSFKSNQFEPLLKLPNEKRYIVVKNPSLFFIDEDCIVKFQSQIFTANTTRSTYLEINSGIVQYSSSDEYNPTNIKLTKLRNQ